MEALTITGMAASSITTLSPVTIKHVTSFCVHLPMAEHGMSCNLTASPLRHASDMLTQPKSTCQTSSSLHGAHMDSL